MSYKKFSNPEEKYYNWFTLRNGFNKAKARWFTKKETPASEVTTTEEENKTEEATTTETPATEETPEVEQVN